MAVLRLKSTFAIIIIILLTTLLFLAPPVSSAALQNITLPLPPGTSNHNTPGLLCTPTQTFDLLIFYLLNYVAHAATVLTRPGERWDDYIAGVIGALFFPALGLYRGLEAIFSGAIFVRGDDLRKAAKSGALCIVVRGPEWRPEDGDVVKNVVWKRGDMEKEGTLNGTDSNSSGTTLSRDGLPRSLTGDTLNDRDKKKKKLLHLIPFAPPSIFSRFGKPVFIHRRIIHGRHSLPRGYRFAILPHDAQFAKSESTGAEQPNIEVSATVNAVKAIIALGQSGYALATLYQARGDQIKEFGFAAFGLTVAPYAVMSIMNLIGNVCRPEYSSMYMVESSIMDEARRRGAVFEGAVARAKENEELAVCGCMSRNDAGGAEDLEEVKFSITEASERDEANSISSSSSSTRTGERRLEAHFTTTDPHAYARRESETSNNSTTTTTINTTTVATEKDLKSLLPTTHPIAPLPYKLDYTDTKNDSLLLLPIHPPLARPTPPSTSESPPARPILSNLRLRRMQLFKCGRTWTASYLPSHSSLLARRWTYAKYFLLVLIGFLPIGINGAMSHFSLGEIATQDGAGTWRAYTLQWLCFGVVTGVGWVLDQEYKDAMVSERVQVSPLVRATGYVMSACPAVGGYVVVGQMLFQYGSCVWIGN